MFHDVLSKIYLPLVLGTFLLCLWFSPVFFAKVLEVFQKLDSKFILLFFLVVSGGFFVRGFATSNKNLQYMDEFDYMSTAKNFINKGEMVQCSINLNKEEECGINAKSSGFTLLVSLMFLMFGMKSSSVIWMNIVLGTFSIILVGLLGIQLFDERKGIIAAIFAALYPVHVKWSSTGEKTIPGLFFALIFLNSAYLLWKEFDFKLMFFTIGTYIYAGIIRPEFFLFLMPVLFLSVFPAFKEYNLFSKLRDSSKSGFFFIGSGLIIFIAGFNIFFELFKQGTSGKPNIFYFGFSNFLLSLRKFLRLELGLIFILFFLVLSFWNFFSEDRFKLRRIISYISVGYLVSFMFFEKFCDRFVLFPILIMFIFLSEITDELFKSGLVERISSIIIVLGMVFMMFQGISNLDILSRKDYYTYMPENYGGCTIFSEWKSIFAVHDDIFGVSKDRALEDKNYFYNVVKNNCTLVFGSEMDVPKGVEQKLIEENDHHFRFNVYNLTMRENYTAGK